MSMKRLSELLETENLTPGKSGHNRANSPDTVSFNVNEVYDTITRENLAILQSMTGINCDKCGGTGQAIVAGKMTYCPDNCGGAIRLRRDNLIKVLNSFGDIPEIYADFTFESWVKNVPVEIRGGKFLALYILQYLVEFGGGEFSLADVMASDVVRRMVKPEHEIKVDTYPDDGGERVRVLVNDRESFNYFNSIGHSVVLASERKGMGKTGLCVAAAKYLIDSGIAVAFVHLPTLLRDTRTAYANSERKSRGEPPVGHGKTYDELMLPIQRADVLFVDDFNVVGDSTRNDMQVVENEIIQTRWASQRPTIITTNHTQDTFESQWGQRAASRVFEMCHWVELTGETVRRKNKPNS